jgi:hypothetical protein
VVGPDVGGVISWIAEARGRALSNDGGTTLWDHNLFPTTVVGAPAPGSTLTLPFIDTAGPTKLFDSIINVKVNGTTDYVFGFSNSPDNAYGPPGVTIDSTNLFWADLYTFGSGNNPGGTSFNIDYAFNGESSRYGDLTDYKVKFLQPITDAIIITTKIQYYRAFAGGLHPFLYQSYTPASPGDTEATYFSGDITDTMLGSGFLPQQFEGHFVLNFTVDVPGYTSVLKNYHFPIVFPPF